MSPPQLPVLGTFPPNSQPQLPKPTPQGTPKKWCFSFQYWRQIEFFGLDRSEGKWFSSLLERLRRLCEEEIDKFIGDSGKLQGWRYHNIDWGQTNIPVQIDDLEWLPDYCKNNQEEFPLLQFQVSQALGRVVGFWDRDNVFCIVLLDPYHNIQPTKSTGYRVDPCNPLSCDYSGLSLALDDYIEKKCKSEECDSIDGLKDLPGARKKLRAQNVLLVPLSSDDVEYSQMLVEEGKVTSMNEIFQAGLTSLYQEQQEANRAE